MADGDPAKEIEALRSAYRGWIIEEYGRLSAVTWAYPPSLRLLPPT